MAARHVWLRAGRAPPMSSTNAAATFGMVPRPGPKALRQGRAHTSAVRPAGKPFLGPRLAQLSMCYDRRLERPLQRVWPHRVLRRGHVERARLAWRRQPYKHAQWNNACRPTPGNLRKPSRTMYEGGDDHNQGKALTDRPMAQALRFKPLHRVLAHALQTGGHENGARPDLAAQQDGRRWRGSAICCAMPHSSPRRAKARERLGTPA